MTQRFLTKLLACSLVLCLLVVSGLASAQALTHETQHSHHQKATHGTVLCSWMCAAGQVLETAVGLNSVELTLVEIVNDFPFRFIPVATLPSSSSRGPPRSV